MTHALFRIASTAFAPLCWWYRLPIGILLVFASKVADARLAPLRTLPAQG